MRAVAIPGPQDLVMCPLQIRKAFMDRLPHNMFLGSAPVINASRIFRKYIHEAPSAVVVVFGIFYCEFAIYT